MRVTVTCEHRFVQTPDGAILTKSAFPYSFWTRYLSVFDSVQVLARVLSVERAEPNWVRADGSNVTFSPIPYYVGPLQFMARALAIRRAVRGAVAEEDAVIMRVASAIGGYLARLLRKTGHPLGLEVVADPYDALSPGANGYWLRPFFRIWMTASLKRLCMDAVGVAYVTKYALQRRYPGRALMVGFSDVVVPSSKDVPEKKFVATHYSSISLKESDLLEAPAPQVDTHAPQTQPLRLICVGTLQELYKGQDVLIRAVAACVKMGDNLVLRLVGDGKARPAMEALAESLSIHDRCEFAGEVTGLDAVVRELDESDVFVLPSRQEGLPRAMVEAMARRLPCIGTTVGGIPELLPPEDMVPPNDVSALATKIHEVANCRERRERMSARSLEIAQEYTEDNLRERRDEFYRYLRTVTGSWLIRRGLPA